MKEPVKRTSSGLRELLFKMIEGVQDGTVNDKTARTIATLAGSILKSVEVEILFRAQVMRGTISEKEIGDMPLAQLPAPPEEPGPAREPQQRRVEAVGGRVIPNTRLVKGRNGIY